MAVVHRKGDTVGSVYLNDRRTTAIGFGGSLLGSTPPEVSRQLLLSAFDAGIRHFDVAPMYAFGEAERLLAQALGMNLREVTITTKYGLNPTKPSLLRRFARTLLQPFPALKRRLQSDPPNVLDEPLEDPSLPPFNAVEAQRSIDQSLRNLGVNTIDLLLLHEATPGRLQDPALLETLERNVVAGKIRQFGIGSRSKRVLACVQEHPEYCRFLQYEWSIFSAPQPALEQYARILHGSVGGSHKASPLQLDLWSHTLNLDLRAPGMLPRLLLKASLLHNAGHITLFSTRTHANIRANVRTAEDASLEAPARAFHNLIQSQPM